MQCKGYHAFYKINKQCIDAAILLFLLVFALILWLIFVDRNFQFQVNEQVNCSEMLVIFRKISGENPAKASEKNYTITIEKVNINCSPSGCRELENITALLKTANASQIKVQLRDGQVTESIRLSSGTDVDQKLHHPGKFLNSELLKRILKMILERATNKSIKTSVSNGQQNCLKFHMTLHDLSSETRCTFYACDDNKRGFTKKDQSLKDSTEKLKRKSGKNFAIYEKRLHKNGPLGYQQLLLRKQQGVTTSIPLRLNYDWMLRLHNTISTNLNIKKRHAPYKRKNKLRLLKNSRRILSVVPCIANVMPMMKGTPQVPNIIRQNMHKLSESSNKGVPSRFANVWRVGKKYRGIATNLPGTPTGDDNVFQNEGVINVTKNRVQSHYNAPYEMYKIFANISAASYKKWTKMFSQLVRRRRDIQISVQEAQISNNTIAREQPPIRKDTHERPENTAEATDFPHDVTEPPDEKINKADDELDVLIHDVVVHSRRNWLWMLGTLFILAGCLVFALVGWYLCCLGWCIVADMNRVAAPYALEPC